MTLREWVNGFKSYTAAAKVLGVGHPEISRLFSGKIIRPRFYIAKRMSDATGGMVTLKELGWDGPPVIPTKPCLVCGEAFTPRTRTTPVMGNKYAILGAEWKRRKYCSLACAGWVGNDAKPDSGRRRATRMYKAEVCERCGGTRRMQRHHRDRNPLNNDRENIEILCQVCHLAEHMDILTKGRPNKLTPEMVLRIRELALTQGSRRIAKQFGISNPTARRVVRRQLWKHV